MFTRTDPRRSSLSAAVLGFSIAAALSGGCSATGEQGNATQEVPAPGAGAGNGASPQAGSASGGPAVASSTPTSSMTATTAGNAAAPSAGTPLGTPAAGSAASSGAAAGSGEPATTAGAGGGAGQAGAAGAAMAAAGAGGGTNAADPGLPPGATNFTTVCAGGKVGLDSDAAGKLRALDGGPQEFSGVKYMVKAPAQLVGLKTTLVVPKTPTVQNVLFIWPGVQNRGGADPGRIGNGILQPVLTWGASCAPKLPPDPYKTGWWISGQYVNTSSGAAGPTGCAGGDYLSTALGDSLEIDMSLKDDKWVQTIKNVPMNKTVDFTIDLKGQVQSDAMWLIEVPAGQRARPAEDTIWLQNVLTFSQPVTTCQPDRKGAPDYFSAPTLSTDGLHCCWDKIVLKADRTTP